MKPKLAITLNEACTIEMWMRFYFTNSGLAMCHNKHSNTRTMHKINAFLELNGIRTTIEDNPRGK